MIQIEVLRRSDGRYLARAMDLDLEFDKVLFVSEASEDKKYAVDEVVRFLKGEEYEIVDSVEELPQGSGRAKWTTIYDDTYIPHTYKTPKGLLGRDQDAKYNL